jgi:predicted SAM-dependent methyltransferase
MNGYTKIDIEPSHEPDIVGDVLTMDFKDVEVIYLSHSFEHFGFPHDALKALKLFYKWLKPDGILRLAVPDLELAVKAYYQGSDLGFLYGGDFKGYYYNDTPGERLNFFVKAWNHQMCYDYTTLKLLLEEAGFIRIGRRNANESLIEGFNHDRFISESLYVECIK